MLTPSLRQRFPTAAAFAALFDHTLLKPDATPQQVQKLGEEALANGFAAVCVNPWHVPAVARQLAGSVVLPITVVGFPLGANTSAVKVAETERAVQDGAREIDMVINVGALLAGDERCVRDDVAAVVRAAGKVPVKVILETAFLTPQTISALTGWCAVAGAAFVKTSTGFGPRGASEEDIRVMVESARGLIKVKASGGIRTLEQALAMAAAGADRIGSSGSVELVEAFQGAIR